MNIGSKIDPRSVLNQVGPNPQIQKRQVSAKAATEFESYFITQMLIELDKTTHFSKKSYAEETHKAVIYQKVGDYLAKKGLGIREMIMKYVENGAKVINGSSDNRK